MLGRSEKGKNPLVSIIIPTFNRASIVSKTIGSALEQTYRNIEVIIIDDCSTDGTLGAISNINDSRIIVLEHRINKGAPAARNTGILAAKGKYITFLDDDDSYDIDKVRMQVNAMAGFDGVLCGYATHGQKRSFVSRKSVIGVRDLKAGRVMGGGTSLLMVEKSIMQGNLFDEELVCNQDWDLLMRLARKYKIGYVREALVLYNNQGHIRISNRVRDVPLREIEERLRAFYKHRDELGRFWFNFRVAQTVLSYVAYRRNRLDYVKYAVKKCGVIAVISVLLTRIFRRSLYVF